MAFAIRDTMALKQILSLVVIFALAVVVPPVFAAEPQVPDIPYPDRSLPFEDLPILLRDGVEAQAVLGAASGETYTYVGCFGSDFTGDGKFHLPLDTAVGPTGTVYVADSVNQRIQGFDSNGNFLLKWGSAGSGDGEFGLPVGIDVGPEGDVYVADSTNHRISKFSASGVFLRAWGGEGSGDGEFQTVADVAVDGDGNVYVADRSGGRIQKFDADGTFLASWVLEGTLEAPAGIAVDSEGNVYAVDASTSTVVKVSPDGAYCMTIGSFGYGDGGLLLPMGIAVDGAGNIYVTDMGTDLIQKFGADGAFLAAFGSSGSGDGEFLIPTGVAVDAAGAIYVVDTYNYRVQKLDSTGAFLVKWGTTLSGDGDLLDPTRIAFDPEGNIYVADAGNCRIEKFDPAGAYLLDWGEPGTGEGEFGSLHDIAIGPEGNVYAVDLSGYRIQKFDADGTFLAEWRYDPSGNGDLCMPMTVTVDAAGYVYVAGHVSVEGTYQSVVQKFDPDGAYVTQWEANYGSGIDADGEGNIYLGDCSTDSIQKFSSTGELLATWSDIGSDEGLSFAVEDIAVDGEGNVFAVGYDSQIRKFSPSGEVLAVWGDSGTGTGESLDPTGIGVDARGNVYVVDNGNCRVLKFAPAVSAGFTVNRSSGYAPLTVAFSDTSAGSPTAWSWTFGDGSTSTEQSPVYTYETPGTYTVGLTATDAGGSDTVTVTDAVRVLESGTLCVTNAAAVPPVIPTDTDGIPGTGETTGLSVTTTGANVASVTVDLSEIGGSSAQPMADAGDETRTASTTATIPSPFEDGAYQPVLLAVNATDVTGAGNTSVTIALTVVKNGDANEDCRISLYDAVYAARHYLGIEGYPMTESVGMVSGGDALSLADAAYLAKHILGVPGYELLH